LPARWKAGIATQFGRVALLEERGGLRCAGIFFVRLRRACGWLAGSAACRLEAGATGTRRGSALRWGRGAA